MELSLLRLGVNLNIFKLEKMKIQEVVIGQFLQEA